MQWDRQMSSTCTSRSKRTSPHEMAGVSTRASEPNTAPCTDAIILATSFSEGSAPVHFPNNPAYVNAQKYARAISDLFKPMSS